MEELESLENGNKGQLIGIIGGTGLGDSLAKQIADGKLYNVGRFFKRLLSFCRNIGLNYFGLPVLFL